MRDVIAAIVVLVVFVTALVLGNMLDAQPTHELPQIPKPVPVEFVENDTWVGFIQPGSREIYFRRSFLQAMVIVDRDGPIGDKTSPYPTVKMLYTGHEFRLDLLNEAEQKKLKDFVLEGKIE